jgi:hypothetical protein
MANPPGVGCAPAWPRKDGGGGKAGRTDRPAHQGSQAQRRVVDGSPWTGEGSERGIAGWMAGRVQGKTAGPKGEWHDEDGPASRGGK